MTLHTYILKFYIMMKMIGLILLDPLNQKIHGKIEQKKSFEFSIPDSDKQFKYFKVFISDKSLTFK